MQFFRGTSAASDFRFADKTGKQIKAIGASAPPEYAVKVHMSRVYRPIINGWIEQRINELLGIEDELLIGTVQEFLGKDESPDPRELQMYLTGFLEKKAQPFVAELWGVLASAQSNKQGALPCWRSGLRCELDDHNRPHFPLCWRPTLRAGAFGHC
jgi:serine/arginine repetitive matrix protein 1